MKARGPKLYPHLKTSGQIDEKDFKYVPAEPEPGFSVEHNRRVIEESIKKNDRLMRQKQKEFDEAIEERTDASVSFLQALIRGKYNSSDPHTAAMKYFGKKELARLRGEEIRQQLMDNLNQNKWMVEDIIRAKKNN